MWQVEALPKLLSGTKYINTKSITVSVPASEMGPSPRNESECAPPPGGEAHSPGGEGMGSSQFQRLEKKHNTLSTLCCQVKVRGHRIDLSEIEAAAHRIAGVSRACALCFRPGQPDQRVLCYYTAEEEEEGKGF